MGTPERIYELVKALPENQAAEILDFAEFLLHKANLQAEQSTALKDSPLSGIPLSDFAGILKDSPNFNEDPVELQRRMRDEGS